jgi:TonB family protein
VDFDDELGVVTQVSDVYGEDQVEVRPTRLSGPMPRYPAMLRQAGIEGAVMLEFVIDEEGRVDTTSIEVMESTNRAFDGPSRDVVACSLFTPGEKDGEPVRVLVQQQIGFSIGTQEKRQMATEAVRELRFGSTVDRPLIMVDDEIVQGDIPEDLDPDQIDRIEVIKGAAAEALMGERGANGIIKIYLKDIAITATRGNE